MTFSISEYFCCSVCTCNRASRSSLSSFPLIFLSDLPFLLSLPPPHELSLYFLRLHHLCRPLGGTSIQRLLACSKALQVQTFPLRLTIKLHETVTTPLSLPTCLHHLGFPPFLYCDRRTDFRRNKREERRETREKSKRERSGSGRSRSTAAAGEIDRQLKPWFSLICLVSFSRSNNKGNRDQV